MSSSIPTLPSSSVTVTVSEPERLEAGQAINRILVLKLRQKQKKITWTDDTVDNEHLGKKSSKSNSMVIKNFFPQLYLLLLFLLLGCCIFHKKKNFGESDSDETDSEDENISKAKREKIKNYQRFHA